MGRGGGGYRGLVGKPEGMRPLGRPRSRWKDNIKMDLEEVGWGVWTGSSWLRIGTNVYNQSPVVIGHIRVSERCSKRR
jgi:hypothetical protein